MAPLLPLAALIAAASLWACAGTGTVARAQDAPGASADRGSGPGPEAGRPRLPHAGDSRARLEQAEAMTAAGSFQQALQALDPIEPDPEEAFYPQYVWLRARIAAAQGDTGLARYYANEVISTSAGGRAVVEALLLLGDMSYASGDRAAAFQQYLEAANRAVRGAELSHRQWLRLAEVALYDRQDAEGARHFLSSVRPEDLSAQESSLLRRIGRRLRWRTLGPAALGLSDGNVSALTADGDDLWVGTWDGAVARYSMASGQVRVLREGTLSLTPTTVRSLAAGRGRVWIGTYQGLYAYAKATSSWQAVRLLERPVRVEAIAVVGERVFVGTLGDGLWVQEDGGWRRLSVGGLPGDFVTCLLAVEGDLLIGTMTLGVVSLNLATGGLRSLDLSAEASDWASAEASDWARGENVTMLLHDPPGRVWVGTYGGGLYRWDRNLRRIEHFSRAGGQLPDDWILSGVRATGGLYFGTFGGGVIRLAEGRWSTLGLREGLAGLDISSAAWLPPYVCFGTLGAGVSILDEGFDLGGSPPAGGED